MPKVDPLVLRAFEDELSDDSIDMVDVLWECVAPQVAEMERARRAILLTVASPRDRNGTRGRLHTLMHGEAGTGKSVLRDWLGSALSAKKTGPKSSDAGLKGSTKGGVYSPGVLPKAHGGMLAPDELDEFDYGDRGALLEAMGKGEFDVTQAGVDKTVPAEVTVVAACNRTQGFREELLDRFDFVVEVEEYDADETVEVTSKLYDSFHDSFLNDGDGDTDRNPLLGYVEWCRSYTPSAEDGAVDACKDIVEFLIRECGESGDIRGKEALMRAAYTWASLNREPLSPYHFGRAAAFIHPEYADDILEYTSTHTPAQSTHGERILRRQSRL